MPDPRPRAAARTPVPDVDLERVRAIKSFPQLVKYLRDDLDWPIDSDSVEDLTYEYTPDELGLDARSAVKVKEIKQLRPLDSKQPWGIFFVNFEPKKLPVVVLRRILRSLVVNKRGGAKQSDRAAWARHDLLFISAYGEGDDRAITFAHFADPPAGHENDLPTLKVLGWDDQDTVLHLDMVHRDLSQHLRWPTDSAAAAEPTAWRARWSKAFTVAHGEVVRTSKDLAVRLAELAARIRKRARTVLAHESEKGELRTLHKAFQESLIHDLSQDDFADMYAQTIAYGLLTAAVSRHSPDAPGVPVSADSAVDMVPITNPFLKEMLERFLKAGGRNGHGAKSPHKGIDFDELGVSEVVDLLRTANMDAVLRDFGNRNPLEDPVIHFYELFLKEYDPKKRMQRGVFYTPRPVVSFIVRSVHEILQKEFGLGDGLADTATWADMVKRNPELKLPEIEVKDEKTGKVSKRPIDAAGDFVQILDPATGTGTFLVEVIDVIHKTLVDRWTREKKTRAEITKLWNEYVPAHLLPRLHGYELMPAPYAIAHMKIGLKLHETGYGFGSEERVRVYLTNALEPAQQFSDRLEFDVPALAHEAKAVNAVKRLHHFTIVIGNPPYAKASSNRTETAERYVAPFKESVRSERNLQPLSDDYVKFLGFGNALVARVGYGVLAMITNRGYLDGLIHRGMRAVLVDYFPLVRVVDLHGDTNVGEAVPEGLANENVFDIQQGVAIGVFARSVSTAPPCREVADVWGSREEKYGMLASVLRYQPARAELPDYRLVRKGASSDAIPTLVPLQAIFPITSTGIKTHRDHLVIDVDPQALAERIRRFIDPAKTDAAVRLEFFGNNSTGAYPPGDNRDWSLTESRRRLKNVKVNDFIRLVQYRPFDYQYIFLHPAAVDFPRSEVCDHLGRVDDLALIANRQFTGEAFNHAFVTRVPAETKIASHDRASNVFPLWVRGGVQERVAEARHSVCPSNVAGRVGFDGASPQDCAAYAYAIMYSPTYRVQNHDALRRDFPGIPAARVSVLRERLVDLGQELIALHLMESPRLRGLILSSTCQTELEIEKVSFSSDTVWLDKAQTRGFRGVPEPVWNFHIGGYQVCEKWLKDRKGRTLSKDDIEHYQKIIVAISETLRIMGEIDKVIEEHGGWPGAFITDPKELEKLGLKSAASTAANQAAPRPDSSPDREPEDDGGTALPFA